jgi:hypothetical protein
VAGQEAGKVTLLLIGSGISVTLTNQRRLTSRDQCSVFTGICWLDMAGRAGNAQRSALPRRQQCAGPYPSMHSAYVTMKKPYWRFPDEHANFYIEPGSPPDFNGGKRQ